MDYCQKSAVGESLIQAPFEAAAESTVVKSLQKKSIIRINQALLMHILVERSFFTAIVHYYDNMFLFSNHVLNHRMFSVLSLNNGFKPLSMKFFTDKSLSTCAFSIEKSYVASKLCKDCLIQVATGRCPSFGEIHY